MLVLLLACAKPPVPAAPAPVAAPAAAPAPAAEALAPRLFDAAGLRDGFVLGTKMRLRIEMAGAPAVEEAWTVTEHTAEGCTIHTVTHDGATGAVVGEETGTSTWAELESHASFPLGATAIADDTVTVPAGTFETRRYTVTEDDGTVKVLHFSKTLAGPPVRMEVSKDGVLVMSMTLLERTSP